MMFLGSVKNRVKELEPGVSFLSKFCLKVGYAALKTELRNCGQMSQYG